MIHLTGRYREKFVEIMKGGPVVIIQMFIIVKVCGMPE